MNPARICIHPEHPDKLCWLAMLANAQAEVPENKNLAAIQDDIIVCYDCKIFIETTERGFGRRSADQAIGQSVVKLMEQLSLKKRNLQQTANALKKSLEQLGLLKSLSDALARSDRLEKSLRIILTGATSGEAFGFNRAAVFLINENRSKLEGRSAIGPTDYREAAIIWRNIAPEPLERLLEQILIEDSPLPFPLEQVVSKISLPLEDKKNPLVAILHEAREKILRASHNQLPEAILHWWPNSAEVALAPLISEGRPLGVIIADNAITRKPITAESLESLKALANTCSSGLQNAILHEQLQAQLKELERVHELFRSNQAYLMQHERLADMGALATKVAHEFKIPLVTIGGYARRIRKTIGSHKFDEKMVDVIISEIDRLSGITSEILEYSRYPKLNIKECNLNKLIDETLSLLEDRLKNSMIISETFFAEQTLTIKADPERLKQVLLNIIDNAMDAMKSGGKLTIKTSRHNEYVGIEIADTGTGIDKSELENLFNLFYTTKDKGSGLGLPVTKKIVDDHGGNISVNSVPGEGTVFSIHLPDI